MKRIDNYFALCLSFVMAISFASCVNEDEALPCVDDSYVTLTFSIANSSTNVTRAIEPESSEPNNETPEEGNDALNENTINSIDIFIFDSEGNQKTIETESGVSFTGYESFSQSEIELVSTDNVSLKRTYKWKEGELPEMKASDLVGCKIYVIANWQGFKLGTTDKYNESQLKAAMAAELSNPYDKQTDFEMVGEASILSGDVVEGETTTVNIEIARVLAKVRIAVHQGTRTGTDITFGYSTTVDGSTTTIPLQYQLKHFTKRAMLVDDSGESAPYSYDVAVHDFPQSGFQDLTTETALMDNGKAAFYSYANYWYDSSKQVHIEEPIDTDRQTYVLLYAPYVDAEGTATWGYYKVPINYRLQQDNDKKDVTVNTNLYQIKRNHIYDITVVLDRVGGTNEDTATYPTIIITDWEDTDPIDIVFDNEFTTVE